MTRKIASILFMSAILFTAALAADYFIDANALKSKGVGTNQYGSSTNVCGDKLCSEYEGGKAGYEAGKEVKKADATETIEDKISEIEKEIGEKTDQPKSPAQKQLEKIQSKIDRGERLSKGEIQTLKKIMNEYTAEQTAEAYYGGNPEVETGVSSVAAHAYGSSASGTMTSVQDPGQGHEAHQIAVILPPTDKVYVGKVTFSASEQVQYVTIHGPLAEGESRGQPIWSPMGNTKYALTFIDNGAKSGGWYFAGNALALHTMHDTPFTATYSVAYAEVNPGVYPKGTVESGTVTSIQDPGLGHEQHSLALILPPRDIPYQGGVVAYSASEEIQLVALLGPLEDDEINGQTIWTPDGETKYALTIVEGGNMGVWNTFSGNALALHSFNPDGFTASYSLAGLH
jgi:hypothetical protein